MALSAILATMKDAAFLNGAQYQSLTAKLNACYAAVEKDDAYKPGRFLESLHAFEVGLPRT